MIILNLHESIVVIITILFSFVSLIGFVYAILRCLKFKEEE